MWGLIYDDATCRKGVAFLGRMPIFLRLCGQRTSSSLWRLVSYEQGVFTTWTDTYLPSYTPIGRARLYYLVIVAKARHFVRLRRIVR